jgi:hypothetical protein
VRDNATKQDSRAQHGLLAAYLPMSLANRMAKKYRPVMIAPSTIGEMGSAPGVISVEQIKMMKTE